MIDLLPFTRADRGAFQGVEKPDEGDPVIGTASVTGSGWTEEDLQHPAAVIVDRGRVGVNAAQSCWQLDCCYELGLIIARHLDDPIRVEQLRRWGFEQIV